MAIEYSGYVEVPRSDSHGGGTVQIPFNFQSDRILTFAERREHVNGIYQQFRSMLTDYDESRAGQYGEIQRYAFTSVVDIGFQRWEDPHAGQTSPDPRMGR